MGVIGMKKSVCIKINSDVFDAFKIICIRKGWKISSRIEDLIKNDLGTR
jgi:hypothetical protein